jgi:genome maintenance exonuclease 1
MKNDPFTWKKFNWEPLDFKEIESVTNEETGKRFYKTPIGNFPSMTTILAILDDGGIDAWIKRVGIEEAEKIKNEASARGNSLHDLSEKYLRNELERSELHGKGKVLFNRNKPLLDTINPVLATEIPLYSNRYGFAGRVDCIAYINGILHVIDHKNSRREIDVKKKYARRKMWKYYLQCVGYAICIEEMFGLKPIKGCIIVGNHELSNSSVFKFPIESYRGEFEKLIEIYNGARNKKDSLYYRL